MSDRIAILSYFHVENHRECAGGVACDAAATSAKLQVGEVGILTKADYLPTPLVVAFIEALKTVAKQMQQDAIADGLSTRWSCATGLPRHQAAHHVIWRCLLRHAPSTIPQIWNRQTRKV